MTASLKALQSAKSKIAVLTALVSLVTGIHPSSLVAHAQAAGSEKSIVFEIKTQNPGSLITMDHAKYAKIDKKVTLVREYLESKGAPLADYTEILLAQDDWKTILAISNAESSLGKRCYYNNCSGIYGQFGIGYAGLKKYDSTADWIIDLQKLIDRRYKGWTLKQMNGIYVYPRSSNWYAATTKVYNDLVEIEQQVETESA